MEFALVVPLLIFLLFAIISYGYMLSFRQGLSQAAAEGARAAAISMEPGGAVADSATDAVNDALSSYGVECVGGTLNRDGGSPEGECTIAVGPCPENESVDCAKVRLDYHYREHALVPGLSLPGLDFVLPEHLVYTSYAQVGE